MSGDTARNPLIRRASLLSLLYGTGMRLMEGLRLRIKDVDFSYDQILIRDGKGAKDRVTMLPSSLKLAQLGKQGVTKPATCHTLGIPSLSTSCYDIRTVQELLGLRISCRVA